MWGIICSVMRSIHAANVQRTGLANVKIGADNLKNKPVQHQREFISNIIELCAEYLELVKTPGTN